MSIERFQILELGTRALIPCLTFVATVVSFVANNQSTISEKTRKNMTFSTNTIQFFCAVPLVMLAEYFRNRIASDKENERDIFGDNKKIPAWKHWIPFQHRWRGT